jgi:hypothetical protein
MLRRPLAVFGALKLNPLPVAVERTPDLKRPGLHIYILSLEAQELALPHASGHSQHVKCLKSVRVGRLKQGASLLGSECLYYLLARGPWSSYDPRYVARHEAIGSGLFERLVKGSVNKLHHAGCHTRL